MLEVLDLVIQLDVEIQDLIVPQASPEVMKKKLLQQKTPPQKRKMKTPLINSIKLTLRKSQSHNRRRTFTSFR